MGTDKRHDRNLWRELVMAVCVHLLKEQSYLRHKFHSIPRFAGHILSILYLNCGYKCTSSTLQSFCKSPIRHIKPLPGKNIRLKLEDQITVSTKKRQNEIPSCGKVVGFAAPGMLFYYWKKICVTILGEV